MAIVRSLCFVISLLVGSSFAAEGGFRSEVKPHQAAQASPVDTGAQVLALHAKLEKMATAISAMVTGGSLSNSKIAPTMKAFVTQLHSVLEDTKGSKDVKALKRLQDAQAGIRSLVGELTHQQEHIMKEGEEQEQSLLLGVLMTKQNRPMNEQLAVLQNDEFSHLACVKSVLAAKDMKTPLFKQIAAYLDTHSGKPAAAKPADGEDAADAIPDKLKAGKDGKPDVSAIVSALQTRLKHLEESTAHEEKLHKHEMTDLETAVKKELAKKNAKAVKHIQLIEKKEQRQFAKQYAVAENDIKSMKGAIQAIQNGDMKLLAKSQAALEASMKAMQAQTGGFLYLIQLGHRSEGMDCPYCAAQCVDKCHVAGKSYVTCLTDCADAGK